MRLVEDSQDIVLAHNQMVLAFEHNLAARVLAEENLIARLHFDRDKLALVGVLALADGDDLALLRLSLAVSGMMIPPLVRSISLIRLIRIRSPSGLNPFIGDP